MLNTPDTRLISHLDTVLVPTLLIYACGGAVTVKVVDSVIPNKLAVIVVVPVDIARATP